MEKEKTEEIENKLQTRKQELSELDSKYEQLTQEKEKELNDRLESARTETYQAEEKLKELNEEIVEAEDTILFQEYGLYEPKYNFINATAYKERLDAVRKQQKQMVKDKTAAIATKEWTVDGDKNKRSSNYQCKYKTNTP